LGALQKGQLRREPGQDERTRVHATKGTEARSRGAGRGRGGGGGEVRGRGVRSRHGCLLRRHRQGQQAASAAREQQRRTLSVRGEALPAAAGARPQFPPDSLIGARADLHEALGAEALVAAVGAVEASLEVQHADGALRIDAFRSKRGSGHRQRQSLGQVAHRVARGRRRSRPQKLWEKSLSPPRGCHPGRLLREKRVRSGARSQAYGAPGHPLRNERQAIRDREACSRQQKVLPWGTQRGV
jgi:hypothetical protein